MQTKSIVSCCVISVLHLTRTLMIPLIVPYPLDSHGCRPQPRARQRIDLPPEPCGVAHNHGVWWQAPGHEGVSCYNTISPQKPLNLIAHNRRSLADPTTFPDPNSASLRGRLQPDWQLHIVMSVVVVHDQY